MALDQLSAVEEATLLISDRSMGVFWALRTLEVRLGPGQVFAGALESFEQSSAEIV